MAPHEIPDWDIPSSSTCNSDSDNDRLENDPLEPIAIIGMALKFPGEAINTESFWETMMEGRNVSQSFPKSRMKASSFHHPDKSRDDTFPVQVGHFLAEDIATFDAPFFSISATEAAALDPQQRKLLETSYRALENAGIPLGKISGSKTSVYSACFTDDYKGINSRDPEHFSNYSINGIAMNMLANRLSWFYNLSGASLNVDSACSSSLTAFDLACQSLRSGDANMSIVSGCNLIFNIDWMYLLNKIGFLSPDGKCFSFDHRGNGYGRGEGIGVVILKRLSDAVRDGNVIRAVVRSTGSNCDGRTAPITQPSRDAQAILIRETYDKAGLDMSHTRFVEAHGTGTAVGDPIECRALGDCFRKYRSTKEPLYIGALKSNVGHLEGASGLAGIIKTVLILERGLIPPNTNFEKANPDIDTNCLHIEFPLKSIPWPCKGLRRASVNSFGFGGSNSHAVLDDSYNYLQSRNIAAKHWTVRSLLEDPWSCSSPEIKLVGSINSNAASISRTWEVDNEIRPLILTWSAFDETALNRINSQYQTYFQNCIIPKDQETKFLRSIANTLNTKRTQFPWRSCVVTAEVSHLLKLNTCISKPRKATGNRRMGFIFTGQGAQWFAMGRQLLAYSPFKTSLLRANKYFKECGCPWSLIAEFLRDQESSKLSEPAVCQPVCTALQLALVDLLRSFNIHPVAVIGHSSGEIAAAYTAGAISARSACRIAYHRGFLAETLSSVSSENPGAMMAVGLSESEVSPYLDQVSAQFEHNCLTAACMNSPKSTTISGSKIQVFALKSLLERDNIFARLLNVSVAYHSSMMNTIASDYLELLRDIEPGPGGLSHPVQMISSVTGSVVAPKEVCRGEYWVANLISPVRFSEAMGRVRNHNGKIRKKLRGTHREFAYLDDVLEIGPHAALQGPIRDIFATVKGNQEIGYSSLLIRNKNALGTTLSVVANFYCLEYPVNLEIVNGTENASGLETLIDLPEYPFNHPKTYWMEPRISKAIRFRDTPLNDLLGSPVPDWNPMNAGWRNFISISKLPWIEDHKINNTILYPAAGMLVMAIEAAKQLSNRPQSVLGFQIKDAVFRSAISLPATTDEVETQLSLQPSTGSSDKMSSWSAFTIYIFQNQWMEVCRGNILVEYRPEDTIMNGSKEESANVEIHKRLLMDAQLACTKAVDSEALYKQLADSGYQYGPSFQRLENIYANDTDHLSIASCIIHEDTKDNVLPGLLPYSIHPTTLDGLLQLVFVALMKGCEAPLSTMVPTRINKLWIANSGLSFQDETVNVIASSVYEGHRKTHSTISVMDKNARSLLFHTEGLKMTIVESSSSTSVSSEISEQLVCAVKWMPDIELLSSEEIGNYCREMQCSKWHPASFFQDIDLLMSIALSKALSSPTLQLQTLKPHLHKYLEWARRTLAKFHDEASPDMRIRFNDLLNNQVSFDAACLHIQSQNDQGKLYAEVISRLESIVTGEVEILALLFNSTLAKDFYDHVNENTNCYHEVCRHLDAMAHKNPSMKILEIGAGTGSSTDIILKALKSNNECRYASYDFTDISASFFEKSREKFGNDSRMTFRTLNIEEDPLEQQFEGASYDLIIAANVLHATSDITLTLKNVRKLLKPGGKLVLFEVTRPDQIRSSFVWGLLPGWWLSVEDFRTYGPCMPGQKWNELLNETGFSGNDLMFPDYEDVGLQLCSIIVSTAREESNAINQFPPIILVVNDDPTKEEQQLATLLESQLLKNGVKDCRRCHLEKVSSLSHIEVSFLIFLLELDQELLPRLDSKTFGYLQTALTSTCGVLWVNNSSNPDHGWMDGLTRVLQTEYPATYFVTLALESTANISRNTSSILKTLTKTIQADINNYESKYAEFDGIVQIPRAMESKCLNTNLVEKSLPRRTGSRAFGACPPMEMRISSPGLLDTLYFTNDSRYDMPLDTDSLEIEVKSIGVNFMDCLVALGQINDDVFGTECAGIITRVGSNGNFKVGDRVCGNMLRTYRTLARSKVSTVRGIPDDMTFSEAASLPTTFGTAYHALRNIARLEAGESILIHAGAGGTGQAAIQIAQYLGAEIFTTVGSEDKRTLLMSTYGIPEDHIFYSRDMTFAAGVKRMTRNEGVDVILNSLSGDGLVASWECIKAYGRFVEIGKKDIHEHNSLPMFQFAQNVTFSAVDYAAMITQRPVLVGQILDEVLKLVRAKKVKPAYPLLRYKISEVENAFRLMQSGNNTGKMVLEIGEEDVVQTTLDSRPSYCFEEDATYIIAGGLGGLGRQITSWMALNGARNLILLSRNGPKTKQAQCFVDELEQQGIRVYAPACDITDALILKECIEKFNLTMPPIKGCIQASMVVEDSLFSNMTSASWQRSTAPKIAGSWNLHTHLPPNLSFFVLLSSITGVIGQAGQSNYASGNTYQDALSLHRTTLGQKSISIDLGVMSESGWLNNSENAHLKERWLGSQLYKPLKIPHLLALLEYYCDPELPLQTRDTCQVIVGLETPADLERGGIEMGLWMKRPLFTGMAQIPCSLPSAVSSGNTAPATASDPTSLFISAPSAELATTALCAKLARALGVEIEADKPLHGYGVDSLLAVELRTWLAGTFRADISVFELLAGGSAVGIGGLVLERSKLVRVKTSD